VVIIGERYDNTKSDGTIIDYIVECGLNLSRFGARDYRNAGGHPPGRDPTGVIPTAGAWDNPNSIIPGYQPLDPAASPLPGDVVADTDADGNTHVGIYQPFPNGKPGTVSAATKPQQVVHNDWGFRPKQSPTIWRCSCDFYSGP